MMSVGPTYWPTSPEATVEIITLGIPTGRLRIAGVANAVGAVASGVIQAAKALITAPDEQRFRVHMESGVQDFTELEAAVRYAEQEASQLAEAAARRAGAGEVRVKTWRGERIIPMPGGAEVFVDCEVTATAVGRPRLARN